MVNTQAKSAAEPTMNSTLAVECTVSRAAATTPAQVNSRYTSVPSSKAYTTVTPATSVGPNQPLTKEHDDLAALLEALSMHPMVSALEMGGEVNGQQELACQLAYLLPFERDQKQVLLEMDDPTVRLARIQVLLEQLQGDMLA